MLASALSGLPGMGEGFCDFSWNPVIRQRPSTCITPRLRASVSGTSMQATDMRALRQTCSASIFP